MNTAKPSEHLPADRRKEVIKWLQSLASQIFATFGKAEGVQDNSSVRVCEDPWESAIGQGVSRILEGGDVFERASVNFSDVAGPKLPQAATERRPELSDKPFSASGVSLIAHPRNPFVPTCHMNVRFIAIYEGEKIAHWWFGGGYDLTPYYLQDDDCIHWHTTAKTALDSVQKGLYEEMKAKCDEYFWLPHRDEARGIGGVFFDDFSMGGFANAMAVAQAVGNSFTDAYMPIVERNLSRNYTPNNRVWQLYRRGRYAEFNLAFDRGTKFGLQSKGRIESILVSLPPLASWVYNLQIEPNTPEYELIECLKSPKDWV